MNKGNKAIAILLKPPLFVLLLLTLISCDIRSASSYLREAIEAEDKKDIKGAILLLDKAITKDPQFLPAYINRGADKSLIGDYWGAIDDYNSVLKISPTNTLALVNRARNEKRLGNYPRAVDDLDKAIDSKGGEYVTVDQVPNSFFGTGSGYDVPAAEIRFERAFCFYKTDSLRRAFSDLSSCIDQKYQMGTCLYLRGCIYLAYGKKEKGLNDLKEAVIFGDTSALRLYNQYSR